VITLGQSLPVPVLWAANPLRRFSFLFSAAIHGCLLGLVAFGPRPVRAVRRPIYESEIRPYAKKIIWYRKMPDIAPTKRISDLPHPQGELKSAKTIIANSPQPISSRQLVLQPSPQIKLERDLAAPNLIGLTVPPLPPPPVRKQAKPFIAPAAAAKPRTPAPLLTEPDLTLTWTEPGGLNRSLTLTRPKARPFVAPPKKDPRLPTSVVVLDGPPELGPGGAAGPNALAAGLGTQPKLPGKPFNPPLGRASSSSSSSSGAGSGGSNLEDAPNLASTSNLSAAIIGLNPTDQASAIPPGSRPAQFSVAPTVGKTSTGEVNGAGGVGIPGLMVREGKGERPNPATSASAGSRPSRVVLYEDLAPRSVGPSLSAPLRPASRTIPRALEARFHGRLVYAIVIPAPKLPAYTGDWIVWFAELSQNSGDPPAMRAPVPYRKTELSEVAPAPVANSEARIQLAAVIQPDGRFGSVTLVKGLASPISESAVADLRRWEFRPATRGGLPIGVEVVIEIPFSLAWLSSSN